MEEVISTLNDMDEHLLIMSKFLNNYRYMMKSLTKLEVMIVFMLLKILFTKLFINN